MTEREMHQRLAEAFNLIVELKAEERARAIDRACEGQTEAFRERLERLLEADGDTSIFVKGTGQLETDLAAARASDPEAIGPYRILERLGEGGFGVVYAAEQTDPVRRHVALKLIKPGMDSRAVVARFEAERQALAMMDHPGVAKIFDAGTTDGGLPYFVMELVRGPAITVHCEQHTLGLNARLELFVRVCDAVQHAHSKGVIHRDLKPSNILVVGERDDASPKVIDFGIAKALHEKLTDTTLHTAQGQIIGTPAYMSPEQAGADTADIDTRADVYALGVVLYELLAGVTPFDPETLSSGGFEEMRRIIREVDPPKPSARLSTEGPGHADRGSIRAFTGALRRDLDWVVMRCLEKDRSHRYETASAIGDDIRRFLRDEPVVAGPPSAAYRLRKLARRRRGLVAATGVVGTTLLLGAAGTTAGMVAAIRQADRADAEAVRAERRAAELEEMVGFQEERLGAIDASDMGVTIRGALDGSVDGPAPDADYTSIAHAALESHIFEPTLDEIDRRFDQQPLARARLKQSVAVAMRRAGLSGGALEPQRASLELFETESPEDERSIIQARVNTGLVLQALGELDEALAEYESALLAARAMLGDNHEETINVLSSSGFVLGDLGLHDEAGERLQRAMELASAPEHEGTKIAVTARSNYATHLNQRREYERAEPILREAIAIATESLGPFHESTRAATGNLVITLRRLGKLEEAETLARAEVDQRTRASGARHPDTIAAMDGLASVLIQSGQTDEGVAILERCVETATATLGRDHPDTLIYLEGLANHYGRSGDYETSYRFAEEVSRGLSAHYGPADERVIRSVWRLGGLAKLTGNDEAAAARFERVLDARRIDPGPGDTSTLRAMSELAGALTRLGRFEQAEPLALEFREAATASGNEQATEAATTQLITLYEAWHEAEPNGGYAERAARLRAP
ncbi:MAG: serine/threonine-protein kinase [Planctomycetota bacterium]